MPAASMPTTDDGIDALHRLKSTEPPLYLTPSPELSKAARLASQHLFSSLNPFVPKSPFSHLLTEGFDAEQIWQQIDLQSQPLLSSLRRHVRNFEKNPEDIGKQFNFENGGGKEGNNGNEDGYDLENRLNKESEVLEAEKDDFDDGDSEDEDEDEGEDEDEDEDGEDGEDGEDEDDGDGDEEEKERSNGVEDRFLKINELEEYLKDDEAREYGLKKDNKRKRGKVAENEEDEDDEDEEEEDDEDEEDELGVMGLDNSDEDGNEMENARYEDFFGGKKTGPGQKKKTKQFGGSDNWDMDDEPNNDNDNQKNQILSTHEKEREKLRAEIENIEKANLEPKTWTMQGEVTAAKRPKNSALEVDLDFEHNVRPTPVITEEVTASLEELIQKRILEGQFDDVQKPPTLLNKAPREKVELDETKSKKGLAELYEDEYAQRTGLVSTALTFSDEQKKEASMLFKKLCLKLDALSHFHFTPKPIIEDMSIQANVPALAIEEIAPLAVSDAAMLAPEEVFAGKGAVKEEKELTKEERKRRRANKKRKFKAKNAKQLAIKAAQQSTLRNRSNGNEES